MTQNIATHHVQQFTSNVKALLQQMDERLGGYVMTGNHVGKGASPVDQIGAVEAREVTGRLEEKTAQDVPTDRRWVYPRWFDVYVPLDTQDIQKMLADPTSEYARAVAYAIRRKRDNVIADAWFANAQTGETGGATTAFPSSQQVGINEGGTASGLNLDKLFASDEILGANEVSEDEEKWCAIDARMKRQLLNDARLTSAEYMAFSGTSPTETGRIIRAAGINFVTFQRLPRDGSGNRLVPVWTKAGMYRGDWNDFQLSIEPDKTKRLNPMAVYAWFACGATRVEEKRVVQITCSSTAS